MPPRKLAVRCGTRPLVAKTCSTCSELKLASHFPKDQSGATRSSNGERYWPSRCSACHTASILAIARRTNEESRVKATHHYEEWSPTEIRLLWELDAQGLSTRQLGERLGRSQASIMVQKAKTRVLENEVFLCYYEEGTGKARILGKAYDLGVRGHAGRLNKTAQKAVEMNPGVMFFLMEGGGNMGLRGLDALKQGDDREPEDTSEDVENAPPVVDE